MPHLVKSKVGYLRPHGAPGGGDLREELGRGEPPPEGPLYDGEEEDEAGHEDDPVDEGVEHDDVVDGDVAAEEDGHVGRLQKSKAQVAQDSGQVLGWCAQVLFWIIFLLLLSFQ